MLSTAKKNFIGTHTGRTVVLSTAKKNFIGTHTGRTVML
jgi:hypothetical protein